MGAQRKIGAYVAGRRAADISRAHAAERNARVAGLIAGLAGLLLAAAIATLLSRRIVAGVRQVLSAAEGIAEGDLDQRVDVSSRDEIGQMAAAFGRMIEYLQGNAQIAGRVAAGELNVEVSPRSGRDVLGTAFARMVEQLRGLVGNVSTSAQSLSAASQQMATTSAEAGRAVGEIASAGEVAQGAERQVRAVEQAKLATEEVASASSASDPGTTRPPARPSRLALGASVADMNGRVEQIAAAIQQIASSSQEVQADMAEVAAVAEESSASSSRSRRPRSRRAPARSRSQRRRRSWPVRPRSSSGSSGSSACRRPLPAQGAGLQQAPARAGPTIGRVIAQLAAAGPSFRDNVRLRPKLVREGRTS